MDRIRRRERKMRRWMRKRKILSGYRFRKDKQSFPNTKAGDEMLVVCWLTVNSSLVTLLLRPLLSLLLLSSSAAAAVVAVTIVVVVVVVVVVEVEIVIVVVAVIVACQRLTHTYTLCKSYSSLGVCAWPSCTLYIATE